MKKWMLVVLVLAGSVSWGQAQIKIGNRTINTKKVLNAASEVASAITLSDEDVAALCRESVKWMDEQNPVSDPGSAYSKRLDSLMKKVGEVEGLKLNYKVYEVVDINAFACGDGSIRVFSALMDLMDDDELMAVIGHEIGHVCTYRQQDAMKSLFGCCCKERGRSCRRSIGKIDRFTTGGDCPSLVECSIFTKTRN